LSKLVQADRLPRHDPIDALLGALLVVGAGVHGLSTAWHLAAAGEDVVVVDKTRVGAGASGIACGVIRNNYFQPAMQELMAACVEIWESDPSALHYHGSGYVALGPPAQEGDLVAVHERQQRIGYPSELVLGEAEVRSHMRALYPDWRAQGLTACLHERAGGFAFNRESMLGLAAKASAAGARIAEGSRSPASSRRRGAGHAGAHERGRCRGRAGRVAVGPWIASLWEMLGLPPTLDVTHRRQRRRDVPMWTTGTCRRARSPSTRRVRHGRRAPSPCCTSTRGASCATTRAPDHRAAVGHLLQARPRERSRAAPSR
jgi:glycine/D-amino acid oxidase-like deaminating enzyme